MALSVETKGKIASLSDGLFGFLFISGMAHAAIGGNIPLGQTEVILSILPGFIGFEWGRYKTSKESTVFSGGFMLGISRVLIESGDTLARVVAAGLGLLVLAAFAPSIPFPFKSSKEKQSPTPQPNILASMSEPNTLSSQSKPEKN